VNDVYVAEGQRDGKGGLAIAAALRDSLEKATNSRILYVLAGDFLSPSLLGKWYGGAQIVDAFNVSRLDYATIGNHEFDNSRANLVGRIAESKFEWLSGNCGERDGKPFPGVKGWDTLNVDGVRVGVFGTVIVRDYPSYVQCTDADVVTHALVDTLSRVGSQLIVGITHRNQVEDVNTLKLEPKVQAILGGHDHNGKRDEYDGRLVIKAQSNARTAALVTFTLQGGKWSRRDTVFTLQKGQTEDPKTAAVVAAWQDTLARRIGPDRVIGGSPVMVDATDSTVHRGESVFGNFVAESMQIGTKADVAMINTGALRFDDYIMPGPISTHQIESVLLFADETRAVTFTLTGARLREVLEHGVESTSIGQGAYPQLAGVRFTFDTRLPNMRRIVGPILRMNGTPISDTENLRVTFVSYPACRSGDGYRIPEAAEACRRMEADPKTAPRTVDLIIGHIEGMGGQIVWPKVGNITRVN
jgi:2',3'-cyclic-nucleotide 2'-phosphodiesterase (5'-nucleotidase family)